MWNLDALGKNSEIIPRDQFEITQIDDFSGTTASKGNFPFYNSDTLEIWRFDDENEYEITIDGKQYDSFYSEAYLSGNDKYSVFLDGTHNVTIIRKPNEQRKT